MYCKIFPKLLDSSIWLEDAHVRLVWITFLVMKDADGVVRLSSIGNVANRARVTREQAEDAIRILENPDREDPDQEFQGRRIERIPNVGGWIVLNHHKYSTMGKADVERAKTRERVKRHRDKKKDETLHSVTAVTGNARKRHIDIDIDINTRREEEENAPIQIPDTGTVNGIQVAVGDRIYTDKDGLVHVRTKKGTRLNEHFILTSTMRQWATTRRPNIDVLEETEKFCNHFRSATGRVATKLDWVGTWKNWILNARGTNGQITNHHRQARTREVIDERNRREQIRRELDNQE